MEGYVAQAVPKAVLRVKRKRFADPVEALVLACKRSRLGSAASPDQPLPPQVQVETNVFKLAATVFSQNEPIQKYIQEALSRDKASQLLRPSLGSARRIRKDLRDAKLVSQQESRYRLVASNRPNYEGETERLTTGENLVHSGHNGLQEKESAQKEEKNSGTAAVGSEICGEFQLFDIVQDDTEKVFGSSAADAVEKSCDPDEILCNSVKMIRERLTVSDNTEGAQHREQDDYVYDIYYMEATSQGWIEDILSVKPYTQECELVGAEDDAAEEIYEDDDDENEESNWRNEYPDEDEFLDEDENPDWDERHRAGYSYTSGEGIRGSAWDKYRREVYKEFGYDDMPDIDSD